MLRFERCRFAHLLLAACLVQFARCENHATTEAERLRNTPPELKSSDSDPADEAQARFLPFSASFSLSAGGGASQSFSIASGPDGIGLSQSASHTDSGSDPNGNPGSFSASQSSSIAAGLNGISTANSNSIATNHPLYGSTAQVNGNSLALGQASAAAHGDVVNGQAVSGAQSSVGSSHSQASSSAGAQSLGSPRPEKPSGWTNAQPIYATGHNGDYYHNSHGLPTLSIEVNDGKRPSNGWYEVPNSNSQGTWKQPYFCKHNNEWYRDPRCRAKVTKPLNNQRPFYENTRDPRQEGPSIHIYKPGSSLHENPRDPRLDGPSIHISKPISSVQTRPGGLSLGLSQSQSQSNQGRQPSPSVTINRVKTSGNAQAHAQGSAGSVHHHHHGGLQTNLASGSATATSGPGGAAQATSSSSSGGSYVNFPGPSSHQQIIPKEFIRSNKPKNGEGPIESFITELSDTVYEILDY